MAETTKPRLCFISTGTGDRESSSDAFYAAFDDRDVQTSHVALFDKPNVADIRRDTLPDGYATDAGAGLHFAGTELVTAIADRPDAQAYKVVKSADGRTEETALDSLRLRR
ncbi:hypothetical protein [Alloactinosynnema sp. L-07]|uniref:hypothetical protein n=1 Tax=Alloactinosynnema sp. L-07 TaxID=1653480 RepID=UPI0006B62125|nr:hypothetical protein [Alloactinosynnema sp. L-07]